MSPDEIKRLRESLGWPHARLAIEMGLTENAIRMWERGVRKPRGTALLLLREIWNRLPERPPPGPLVTGLRRSPLDHSPHSNSGQS